MIFTQRFPRLATMAIWTHEALKSMSGVKSSIIIEDNMNILDHSIFCVRQPHDPCIVFILATSPLIVKKKK